MFRIRRPKWWTKIADLVHLDPGRHAFFALDEASVKVLDVFDRESDPTRRAGFLGALACLEEAMSLVHQPVFGPEPIWGENGRDGADTFTGSARILWALAEVERVRYALAGGPGPVERRHGDDEFEAAAGEVLDQLAIAPPAYRFDLLCDLSDAVEPVMGAHAAETVLTIRDNDVLAVSEADFGEPAVGAQR